MSECIYKSVNICVFVCILNSETTHIHTHTHSTIIHLKYFPSKNHSHSRPPLPPSVRPTTLLRLPLSASTARSLAGLALVLGTRSTWRGPCMLVADLRSACGERPHKDSLWLEEIRALQQRGLSVLRSHRELTTPEHPRLGVKLCNMLLFNYCSNIFML